MTLAQILAEVELFEGLRPAELDQVAAICIRRTFDENQVIARPGSHSDECYLIQAGFVEFDQGASGGRRVVVNLGRGQTIGELALLEPGERTATLTAISAPTVVQIITTADFEALCQRQPRIGYLVMRNIAADLAFRLRQRRLPDFF